MSHMQASRSVGAILGLSVLVCAARGEERDGKQGVLTLANGNAVPGEFRPSETADAIRWQGTSFTQPFEFPVSCVSSVQFPSLQPPLRPRGEFALETTAGDVLIGRLTGWTPDEVTIETAGVGTVKVHAAALRRLYRLDDNPSLVFPALLGLAGWRQPNSVWHEDGPQVWTDQDPAVLVADLDVPDRAVIEFELSWTSTPNFVFAVGCNPAIETDQRLDGWRFEGWNSTLAIVRELSDVADVAGVAGFSDKTKRVHLLAYLDQVDGRMQVFLPDGTEAGSISVPASAAAAAARGTRAGRGVRLINLHGNVRLERLRIAHWYGGVPSSVTASHSRLMLADGTSVGGELHGLDAAAENFLVREGDRERSVPVRNLVAAELSSAAPTGARAVAAVLRDGNRVSGEIVAVRGDGLVLASPDVTPEVTVRLSDLRSLTVLAPAPPADRPPAEGRKGRLEVGAHKLTGRLVAGVESATASAICWQPEDSRTASRLKPRVDARIVYRETPKPATATAMTRVAGRPVPVVQPQQRIDFSSVFRKKSDPADPQRDPPPAHVLHLRSGDVIPCTVTGIDETGVAIKSTVCQLPVIPHAKIKALNLRRDTSPPVLKTAKKERLLTIPRLQRASAPTHLLYSRTGDYLRCRVIGLTSDVIRIELQLEEVELPLDRVAQIIWFHPDELPAAEAPPAAPGPGSPDVATAPSAANDPAESEPPASTSNADLAQVLKSNGDRVTFDPDSFDGFVLAGTSDVLGPVRVSIDDADQVLLGGHIALAAAELPYQQWRLHHAVEPLVAQDLPEGAPDQGAASPLVGKAAPEISLNLLAGGRFQLSECKGRIVVLDFWATWCGPCMQTMPLVEEALREFDPKEVRLVSVNLEEPAQHVKSVIERHELKVEVALDTDGVAARRYEANAIPQLVVVDREGKIAKLYVGGGPQMVEQLKAALRELLAPADAPAAVNDPAGS